MAGMASVTMPAMCTSMMPAVFGVSLRRISSGVVDMVRTSLSISIGLPPAAITALAVAMKVSAGTSTSRPSTCNIRRMISSDEVPLLTAMACLAPA